VIRILFWLALAIPAFAAADPGDGRLDYAGQVVVVTGSTDGLGRELARAFAAQGAHVVVHGRNRERGEALVQALSAGPGSAEFLPADFSSLAEVRRFADTVRARHPRIALLVNNAGVAVPNVRPRQLSQDGHELQFAVNYLAGWVLVHRLRPALAAAAPSRILNVAAGSAQPIDFDDVMLEAPGAAKRGYGQSKLAQLMMTRRLAPEFLRDGITMIALHPATRMPTTMVLRDLGISAESTLEQGRDHVLDLATRPSLDAGEFYREGQPTAPRHPQGLDAAAIERLAALSTQLTGEPAAR